MKVNSEQEPHEQKFEHLPDNLFWSPDGEIRVTGHRIGLYCINHRHQSGQTPEEILAELPTLTLDQIRKTIAFYNENRHEVGAYLDQYRTELERQEAASLPSPTAIRMRRMIEENVKAGDMA